MRYLNFESFEDMETGLVTFKFLIQKTEQDKPEILKMTFDPKDQAELQKAEDHVREAVNQWQLLKSAR